MRRAAMLGFCALVGACGSDATSVAALSEPTEEPAGLLPPAKGHDADPAGDAPRPSSEPLDPPCDRERCADRPIIFIHGFEGSSDDWQKTVDALVDEDPRYDGYSWHGTSDHDFAARSIPRSKWLFSFDYYLLKGRDGRGNYTAGPGRIGTDDSFACASGGRGHLVADKETYNETYTHEYSADLAAFVDDVLKATGAKQVDIAAHSMGGLVTRAFTTFYGGAAEVHRILLAASPIIGLPLTSVGGTFGVGEPWMKNLEMVELDSGSILSRPKFIPCGSADGGTWASQLTLLEKQVALPDIIAVTGSRDIAISYSRGHHEKTRLHVVAQGATHGQVPVAPETIALVKQELGGDATGY